MPEGFESVDALFGLIAEPSDDFGNDEFGGHDGRDGAVEWSYSGDFELAPSFGDRSQGRKWTIGDGEDVYAKLVQGAGGGDGVPSVTGKVENDGGVFG